jgi:predicted dehydrogenase
MTQQRPIRVGVVGLGRGQTFIDQSTPVVGMELVALCDTWEERLVEFGATHGVATYTDFDAFLEHDMDAVVLANYFHEHADFAIKALRAGKHVMSETAASFTPAEGAALVREVERSGLIYMFADNYPFMAYNQEMRRLYRAGDVGDFRYGEGEYVHPISAHLFNSIAMGPDHWRNWIPVTYYCSHSLAPVMYITDTAPVKVSGFVIAHDPQDANKARTVRRSDTASVIMLEMDNGAMVKLLQYDLRGHGNYVRIVGNRGLMENGRGPLEDHLRVRREPFEKPAGVPVETSYLPDFPVFDREARATGHGGGDFFMNYEFAQAIRTGVQPYFDVYKGVQMALVGALAYRSALEGSGFITLPDLHDSAALDLLAQDHFSPDPATRREGDPWPSVLGDVRPTPEGVAYAGEVWSRTDELLFGGGLWDR